uniref:Uncharacterized protein n=1 Tax=Globisporangium ultimum (strain ATCC 200006 / CBS 805.95 / DAOM BR144) TaxID=431595 RepID=K3WQ02_GLOUD
MSQKAQVLAYDREKRVYKDAYVDNFRKVRYFPSLATIGAGRSDGENIILVQESPRDSGLLSSTRTGDATTCTSSNNTTRRLRSSSNNNNLEDVPSRLMPLDSLEAMFETTPPLSSFRSAVLCKHTKHRRDMGLSPLAASSADADAAMTRFGISTTPSIFMPPSAVDAKRAIARKVTYDPQTFVDCLTTCRPPAVLGDGMPRWSYNNLSQARDAVRFESDAQPPAITANRQYTQQFIRDYVAARQRSNR